MCEMYAWLILNGEMSIDDVPLELAVEVKEKIESLESTL